MTAVRETLRSLVRAPGFALSVVVTLGLAVGANAAIFTLVDQVVFRPLPVEKPAELVAVSAPPLFRLVGPATATSSNTARSAGGEQVKVYGLAYPTFADFGKRIPVFSEMLAFFGADANLVVGDGALEVHGLLVTDNYFRMLGIRPALGRFPASGGERVTGDLAVAVLSHGFWQRQFGGDRSVLNRVIRLNDTALTVIGVAPAGFTGTVVGQRVDFFVPLQMAEDFLDARTRDWGRKARMNLRWDSPALNRLSVMVRLAPGQSRRDAEKAADAVYHQMQTEAIAAWTRPLNARERQLLASFHLTLLPAGFAGSQQEGAARTLDAVLSLLMAMVALVLVVAAGNVANLQVARGSAQARETAIRFALGATRWRLLRARLAEALALALLAGGVGFLLSSWLTALVPAVLGLSEMPPGVSAVPDRRVAVFTALVSAATGVLIWAVSALQITRRAGLPSLSGSSRQGGRARGMVLRRAVVLAQVTLSAALVCGAALLARSLIGLMLISPGFDINGVATFTVTPGGKGYDAVRARALVEDLIARTRALPGVVSATASSHLPLSGPSQGYWLIADDPGMDRGAPVSVDVIEAGSEYFETVGLRLAAGRGFATSDRAGSPKVAVLSEGLARQLFGGRPAVGRRVTFSRADATDTAVKWANRDAVFDIEVVGVVRDARSRSLRTPPAPTIYRPQLQANQPGPVTILFRTRHAMPALRDIQSLVRQVDATVPVGRYSTLRNVVAAGLARERLLAALSSAFGALAAALSAIGVLGLTGYLATRRTHEIGVRLALGCPRGRATRLVMREVAWLAGVGVLAGSALYLGASRYLRSALYELSPTDPLTTAGAVALLMAVTLAAAYIPARRAARVDPAVTLRSE